MEDLPDDVRNKINEKLQEEYDKISSNFPPETPYDISVTVHADQSYDISVRPIQTKEQILDQLPFLESSDLPNFDNNVVVVRPTQEDLPNQTDSEHSQRTSSNQNDVSNLYWNNRREERIKDNNLRHGQRSILDLLAQENKKNAFRNELIAMTAYNYHDDKFIENMERVSMQSGTYDDYLYAKEYVESHPEIQGNKNYWSDTIRYNPKHEAPQPSTQKIETYTYSPTFNAAIKDSFTVKHNNGNPRYSKETIQRIKDKYEKLNEERKSQKLEDKVKEEFDKYKAGKAQSSHNETSLAHENRYAQQQPHFTQTPQQQMPRFETIMHHDDYYIKNHPSQSHSNPYYNSSTNSSSKRHEISREERMLYNKTGLKSKNMIETEKMDQKESDDDWWEQPKQEDYDEEAERQYLDEVQKRIAIINEMEYIHTECSRFIRNGIFSEHYNEAVNTAWNNAMDRLNEMIRQNTKKCFVVILATLIND